ncbi:hypothetical protein MKX01_005097 [Papaver californicum]|nr:hypothetical protein MKX01_005097 [Papaver californicum]
MASSSSFTIFPPPCHHLQISESIPLLSSFLKHKIKFRSLSIIPKASSHLCHPILLQIAETLEDSHLSSSSSLSKQSPILQKLRESSAESVLSLSWPTRKDEAFRFTDISYLRNSQISSLHITQFSLYLGGSEEDECYWVNSVMEVQIGEGGKVLHTYLQQEAPSAAHFKWTAVRQESSSTYEFVEVSSGGKLSRHNLHIQSVGPDTSTEVSTFHTYVNLILDHPRGFARHRHKCIVAHSRSRAVFDGNMRVNRFADQLSRGLILEDGATITMMPKIQASEKDVDRLSHGSPTCGVDEDQLFYLLTCGIDLEAATKALVFAFGSQVTSRLPCDSLRKKVESHVHRLLDRTSS